MTSEAFVADIKTELLRDGSLMGHTIVAARGNDHAKGVLDPAIPTFELRQKACAYIGAQFADAFEDGGPPERVMIARETWSSKRRDIPPSEDPERQEHITITVADFKAGEHYVLFYRILRLASGLDLVLDHRCSADQFEDNNMKAVLHALLDRMKHGTVPDIGEMQAYELSQKDPQLKRVK